MNTTKQTSKELIDAIANDLLSMELNDYHAIYTIGNLANRLIAVIDTVGNEIFNKENN